MMGIARLNVVQSEGLINLKGSRKAFSLNPINQNPVHLFRSLSNPSRNEQFLK